MNNHGIYILANDAVLDQLIALINSIEANVSPTIPICIIPYNDHLKSVQAAIANRPQISIFNNTAAIHRWDNFAIEVWAAHPFAKRSTLSRTTLYQTPLLRKLCAFDGDFDHFVFYDADSLAMKPLEPVFEQLNTYDFIFDDWEHQKTGKATALNIDLIEQVNAYSAQEVQTNLHCSSFFASKRGFFSPTELQTLKQRLIGQQEVAWINRWWDDAFLFNYLTLRSNRAIFNYTRSPNPNDRTGNCADTDPFINIDNRLYNQEGLKPIYRLHYMGYAASDFTRLSRGEDVPIQYRDEFLHYRFRHNPSQRPPHLKKPSTIVELNRVSQKIIKKVQRVIT